MANPQFITCQQYASYLTTQTPVYDKQILGDIRPTDGGLMGYYQTGTFDAYTSNTHRFDRFRNVGPDTRKPWNTVTDTNCTGQPCDPEENRIGWGWDRNEYSLERQSWSSEVLCFDQIMSKTRAKEHFQYIIGDILRPATRWITSGYLARKAADNAGKKLVVRSGLPDFTFTWDAGGYNYMTVSAEPTGRLNPQILQYQVARHYFNGATAAMKDGYAKLQVHTDVDTFRYFFAGNPTLYSAWRISEFGPAAEEFYKYGFMGTVGDFMVKILQFPMRFNKVSSTRFQQVLPYKYEAATEGIKSTFNVDYDKAQYQFSYINNPAALQIMTFNPSSVNSMMPFMVRDYGGKWQFSTHDLGQDNGGRAIENYRQNKGKFWADFALTVKPNRPEWLDLIFHLRDKPCITIDAVCNDYPGYPAQTYSDGNADCACQLTATITPTANQFGQFVLAANGVSVNGTVLTVAQTAYATLAALNTGLNTLFTNNSLTAGWAVVGSTLVWTSALGDAVFEIDVDFVI